MLSTTEIIIRIVVMMSGIILHQMFPEDLLMIVLGIILIFAAPIAMYRRYEHRIYEDPAKTERGEWRDIPEDKLKELLDMIPHVEKVSSGGAGRYAIDGGVIFTAIFLGIWGTGFFGGILMSWGVSFMTVIDIMLTIFNIYRFSGGSLKEHPVSLQADALEQFMTFNLPKGFSKKFQAHIVKDVNGDPDILNVRMQIRPDDPISGLLCMMATISRTNVKGDNYPFAYFVVVFGGSFFAVESNQFADDFEFIINHTTGFYLDRQYKDGNSVFVILPKKPKYHTTADDCGRLCNIMSDICNLCGNKRKNIEKHATPYEKK